MNYQVVRFSTPYTLRVTADGYYTAWDFTLNGIPAVQLDVENGKTTSVHVTLRPREVNLQGRVVDASDGQPVAGAEVALGVGDETHTATTDENGWYRFGEAPVELGVPYTLQVEAEGYLPITELDVTDAATAGSPLPTVQLPPDEVVFTGLVLGHNGEPQAEATVTLRGPDGQVLGETTTDSTGFYRIAARVPRTGELTLTATRDGWTTAMVNIPQPPAAGTAVSQDLGILPNTGSITGQIRRTDGQLPVFGWVDLLEQGRGVVASVPTDLLGRFRFDNVDLSGTGWFALRARVAGTTFRGSLTHRTEMVPLFRVMPGEATVVDLLVEPKQP
ncbi:MAG TPA: carboxypeptidase-like regulatory domain-containing protein [Symbiobacteriaceae bacterium]